MGFAGPLGNIAFALTPLDTFTYDLGVNPYIQFKNTSGSSINVDPTGEIKFRIEGSSLTDAIIDGTGGDNSLVETFAVQLTNQDTSQVVGVYDAKGDFFNNAALEVFELVLNLNGTPLDNDTLYRIDFLTPTVKTLLNNISDSIYISGTDPDPNVFLKLVESDQTLVSENEASYNDGGLTGSETAGTKEFDGSNEFEISGPTVTMDLGDLSDYDNVQKLELRFEGKDEYTSTSPGAILAKLNGSNSLSGNFVELNDSDPYVYGITVDLAGPQTETANELVIEFDEADMAGLQPIFTKYIRDDKSAGNVYVLGYNGSDEVVGYNLFTTLNDSQPYVDGNFMFEGVQPDFTGFYETPPTLFATYTGHTENDLMIDGVTTFNNGSGEQTIPFTLSMYNYGNGTYKIDGLGFKNYMDDMSGHTGPDNVIPVNIFEQNSITLTGENVFQDEFTTTFTWEPDADIINDFFSGDMGGKANVKTHKIGPNYNDVDVDMSRFTGGLTDLSLDLTYHTTSGSALIAPYSSTGSNDYEMFFDPGPGSELRTLVEFEEDVSYTTPYQGFESIDDQGGHFTVTLKFNNTGIALGEVTYQVPVDNEMNKIKFDEEQADPHVEWFEGFEGGEYKFLVKFGWDDDSQVEEEVFLDEFTGKLNSFIGFDHKDKDVSGISVVSIEGYRQTYENNKSMDDPYSYALIGLDSLPPRYTQMVFNGAASFDGSADIDLDYDDTTGNIIVFGDNAGEGTIEFHVVENGTDYFIEKTFEVASVTSSSKDLFFELDEDTIVDPDTLMTGSTFFLGFEDAYGNPVVETVETELKVETPVDSYLIDETGNHLPNAELKLVLESDVPEPISGSAIKWDEFAHLHSNDDGKVMGSIYPGSYLAFMLEQKMIMVLEKRLRLILIYPSQLRVTMILTQKVFSYQHIMYLVIL